MRISINYGHDAKATLVARIARDPRIAGGVTSRRAEKRSVFRRLRCGWKDGGRRCAFPPYGQMLGEA